MIGFFLEIHDHLIKWKNTEGNNPTLFPHLWKIKKSPMEKKYSAYPNVFCWEYDLEHD